MLSCGGKRHQHRNPHPRRQQQPSTELVSQFHRTSHLLVLLATIIGLRRLRQFCQ
jgi:hypothetical protein